MARRPIADRDLHFTAIPIGQITYSLLKKNTAYYKMMMVVTSDYIFPQLSEKVLLAKSKRVLMLLKVSQRSYTPLEKIITGKKNI